MMLAMRVPKGGDAILLCKVGGVGYSVLWNYHEQGRY